MQDMMQQRFDQVLQSLASMQPESKKKARSEDHRAGRSATWAALNITSMRKHWRELADQPYPVVALTETLHHHSDHWLPQALGTYRKTSVSEASCLQVLALLARKGGVGILLSEGFAARELPMDI